MHQDQVKIIKMKKAAALTLLTLALGGLSLSCQKSKKVTTSAPQGTTPDPDQPLDPRKTQGPIGSWRFFCVGANKTEVVTFRGAIHSGAYSRAVEVKDEDNYPLTKISRVTPLSFGNLKGGFMFVGTKLEPDIIRGTPQKPALHYMNLDFYTGDTYWVRSYPYYQIPNSILRDLPWAQDRFAPFGWSAENQILMVPTEEGVWQLVALENSLLAAKGKWNQGEYFNPVYWNGRWLLWYQSKDQKNRRLEAWSASVNKEPILLKSLWTKGKLLDLKVGASFLTALFRDKEVVHWVGMDADFKLQFHHELAVEDWMLGFDPESKKPWVALMSKEKAGEIQLTEWNPALNEVQNSLIKVPLEANEMNLSAALMEKFDSNILIQFKKGENMAWKRRSAQGWSALSTFSCNELSFILDQEATQ